MDTQVVIVGGGPAGAWLALELRLAGIDLVVVERDIDIPQFVRGVTIHPRTAELLEMRGLIGTFLEEGLHIPGTSFGQVPGIIDFRSLETDYQFVLAVPQHRTNQVLQDRAIELGADVRRGHPAVAIEQSSDQVRTSVVGPDGEYVITSEYLVGCDGTQSLVREAAGIEFAGSDSDALCFTADVHLDNPPESTPYQYWSGSGNLLIFHLPGGVYRVSGIAPEDLGGQWPGSNLDFEEYRAKVVRIVGHDFGMRDLKQAGVVGNASRQAVRYREHRVLLAGDAAHRHFPAGGMGMNVSVQDAVNLGWKLGATLNGWAPEGLLDTYSAERHPVGAELLEFTRAQMAVNVAFSPDGQGLRSLVGKLLTEVPEFKHALAERYSGLRVRYPAAEDDHELSGQRVPNLRLSNGDRVYPHFASAKYVVLDFTPDGTLDAGFEQVEHVAGHLDPLDRRDGWSDVTAVLVRPDGYVAWATATREPDICQRQLADAVRRIHATPAAPLIGVA